MQVHGLVRGIDKVYQGWKDESRRSIGRELAFSVFLKHFTSILLMVQKSGDHHRKDVNKTYSIPYLINQDPPLSTQINFRQLINEWKLIGGGGGVYEKWLNFNEFHHVLVRAKTNRNCLLSGLWLPMRLIILTRRVSQPTLVSKCSQVTSIVAKV